MARRDSFLLKIVADLLVFAALGALGGRSSRAFGQAAPALTIPPAVMAQNPDRSFPGLWESLEAGAVLARVGDPAAIWYNPAGMILSERSSVNANAPGYEFTVFSGSGFDEPVRGSNVRGLPNFVGVILGEEVIPWEEVRIGFGVTNPISWRQSLAVGTAPLPGMRSNYVVGSELESFQAIAAIAYSPVYFFRIGASIGFSDDTISSSAQIAAESTTATASSGSMSASLVSANTQQFVSSIGVQYEFSPSVQIGAVIRPPSARLWGNADITYNSLLTTSGMQTQLYFQDSGARFELRQPLQINLGGAVRFANAQIELDLAWHEASGVYDLFTSSQSFHQVTVTAGGAPVVTSSPFPTIRNQTRSVLNASLGSNLKFGKMWTLHSGLYLNQAVTGLNDPFFLPIDFYGLRVGGAVQTKNLAVSLGLGYEVGNSQRPVGVGTLPGAPPPVADGSLSIHTLSLLLALAYTF